MLSTFLIKKNGDWFYNGTIIKRKPLVKLFSSILQYENGSYALITPYEKEDVLVEDLPYFCGLIKAEGNAKNKNIFFINNLGEETLCDASHPFEIKRNNKGELMPAITLRKNFKARVSRAVYYELVERMSTKENGKYGFWSAKKFFNLEPNNE